MFGSSTREGDALGVELERANGEPRSWRRS